MLHSNPQAPVVQASSRSSDGCVISNNSALNTDSAKTADDFVGLVTHAKDFTPDSITKLPADKQVAAKAEYEKQLSQVVELGQQLSLAFSSNDNGKVAPLLAQLSQAKKDGHTAFKP